MKNTSTAKERITIKATSPERINFLFATTPGNYKAGQI
jgi:hypothetical protein